MARGDLTVVALAEAGADPTPNSGDEVNGHQFAWSRTRVLVCRNNSVASINVTIDTPDDTTDGLARTVAQRVVAVPAASAKVIDTRSRKYRQTNGKVYVDVSDDTTVKLGVLDFTTAPA
jgi:hypothetical protein